MAEINKSLGGEENLLALINAANPGANIEQGTVSYGTPEAATAPDAQGERNTKIVLTAVPGEGLSGTKTVYYRRLTLVEAGVSTETTVNTSGFDTSQPSAQTTLAGLVLNSLNILPEGVGIWVNDAWFDATENQITWPARGDSIQLTLRPADDALLYIAGDVSVTVTNVQGLNELLTVDQLDGFDPVSTGD